MTVRFEIITDYVCPWCYLSSARTSRLKRNYDIETPILYFPLHPETPAEGMPLAQLWAGRSEEEIEQKYQQMKILMDQEGLPYGKRTHTYSSRLAQELGKWAATQPGGDAIHSALYQAYFVDARNIGDVDVLLDIAQSVGLPLDEARDVLLERRFKDEVDADWIQSHSKYGVTGVPTFVAGGYGVVGAQPYEVLENLAVKAGAQKREMSPA